MCKSKSGIVKARAAANQQIKVLAHGPGKQLKWAFAPSVPSLTSVSLLPSSVTRSQSAIVDQPFAQYFTSPSHCSVRALLSSLHSDPRWPLKSTTASRPLPLCCDSHAHPAHNRDRYCRN